MRQYLGIVQIFLFFCILQSNSTLTSSYLCTPSILLYQVHRECARTLTIVAALLYIITLVDEYFLTLVCIHELDIKHLKEQFKNKGRIILPSFIALICNLENIKLQKIKYIFSTHPHQTLYLFCVCLQFHCNFAVDHDRVK